MKKRLLSAVLAVFMVLCLIPVFPMTAFAATIPVADEASLTAAIAGAAAEDIIGLTQNITLTQDLTVNKNVTLASAGANLIAGGYRIIIPSGSSVAFGGSLSITGNAPSGYNDGLVVVRGALTLWADSVSISNSYSGSANSNAIYIEGGSADIQGGSVSDTAAGGSNVSSGIYLNGGSVSLDTGGTVITVSGSGYGLQARNGASVSLYAGSVSGDTGVFFNGASGGSFSMNGGSVSGVNTGIRIYNALSGVVISGGTITGTNSYGVDADASAVSLQNGTVTGNAGSGGVYAEGGATLNISRNAALAVTGGIRCANGTIGGTTFLSALPAPVSLSADTDGSVTLPGAATVFTLNAGSTNTSLGASLSGTTVSLHPTAVGTNLPLVLMSTVTWNDGDGDLTETLNLTLPVTVTSNTGSGNWLSSVSYYDTSWYNDSDTAFIITTAKQLAGFAKLVNAGNDFTGKSVTVSAPGGIDLSAHAWVPASEFCGTFDGGNVTISGLTIGSASAPETGYNEAGLFGNLGSATIRNVRLRDMDIYSATQQTGGLAGVAYGTTLTDCSADGTVAVYGEDTRNAGLLLGLVTTGSQIQSCSSAGSIQAYYAGASRSVIYAGGLCGQANGCSIAFGSNSASVHVAQKEAYVGGIGGLIVNCHIENCSNLGSVSNTGNLAPDAENNEHYLGGIAGIFRGTISGCYNTGSVSGSGLLVFCGGIAGLMNQVDTNRISNTYNTGNISASGNETYVGGIVSRLVSGYGLIQHCFNIGMTTGTPSGTAYTGGIISNALPSVLDSCFYLQGTVSEDGGNNAAAKSVANFQDAGTFTGWDFDTVWQFASNMNKYPTLRGNAQTTGYVYPLSFRITDTQGRVLPGVTVTLSCNGSSIVYPLSNAAGYSSSSVPAGLYSVAVSKLGYQSTSGSVTLLDNRSATVAYSLSPETVPAVTTGSVLSITSSSATLSGSVTDDGGATVTARGFVYGASANPAIDGAGVTQVISGNGTGTFTKAITGLAASTTYHVRAFATNSKGTAYGADKTFTTQAASIHVDTEDGGEVVIGAETAWSGAPSNIQGALFYNGSVWVTNDTAAHMYFSDLATGARLKDYTNIAIPATSGTQEKNGISFIAEEYSYQAVAADGSGTYQYTGIKYTITQADGKKIILLSRGLGRGTDAAYLEAFIENQTSGTLAIRDGSVLYSHTGTVLEAAAMANLSEGVMGLLRTVDVYWFDINGGSDMGGLTYSPHTEALSGTLVAAAHPTITNQVVRFDLMLMSAENQLYRYILSPSLTNETFIPAATPAVTSLSPSSGPETGGTSVTITGTNLTGATAVKFGVSNAVYSVNSATQIIAVAPAGTGTVHVTVTTADGTSATTSADQFTYTSSSGGGGGGGSGGGGSVTTTYIADVKEGGVIKDTLPVTVNSAKTGTASLTTTKAAALFSAGNASVSMPDISGVSAYRLELPASALTAGQKGGALTLETSFGSVTFSDNMLSSLSGADGKTAGITVAKGDVSGLTDAEKAAIGDRPIVQLTLTLDGVQTDWNNPTAPVTVTMPYTPTTEELKNPESLIIWYLDGSGKLVCVPNGHYDAVTGTVTFKSTHFSRFTGGYNPVSFKDLADGAWCIKAVAFIAARGITTGTGNGNYSPDAKLTRGEFIVLLMRAYEIAPDANPTNNFADAGNTYYTNYLAAAKRLGISNGVGNNMFAPDKEITRQEMFTLLYNALSVIGQLPDGAPESSHPTLNGFSDADRVAPWATDAVKRLVETGIVSGNGDSLAPEDFATRAEIAQLLYNLLLK